MKNKHLIGFSLIIILLTGCTSASNKVKLIEEQNRNLTADLKTAHTQISALEKEKTDLISEIEVSKNVSVALKKEKGVRTKDLWSLRQDIRTFIKKQIVSLREFSKNQNFLDYLGGELIDREKIGGKNLTLIDVKNAMPSNGTMLGTRGFFTIPCSYHVLVLRQSGKGWFVVWESGTFMIEKAGLKQFEFKIPVSVNKGDIMGYVFENSVGVPYDLGTGNMMYTSEKLSMGNFILLSKLKDKSEKRAYSLGVLGIFE